MENQESPPRLWIRELAEARQYPDSFFYLDCENEIPVTSPVRLVKCGEESLQKLCDDFGLYGPLTDATNCIFFIPSPNEKEWSKEQLSGEIWVAPEYEKVLGPAIRRVLSGGADDIYNDQFDPTVHFVFSNFPKRDLAETPIYHAALYGHTNTFERMLRCSPNIHVRNTDGNTPLHGAAAGGMQLWLSAW